MLQTTKIATCCYCGTRAALVLGKAMRHELACSACGAPLHELKRLRCDAMARPDRPVLGKSRVGASAALSPRRKPVKKIGNKPRKKRKGLMHKLMEEAWEAIEDLLD